MPRKKFPIKKKQKKVLSDLELAEQQEVKVVRMSGRRVRQQVSFGELKVLIADSLERLGVGEGSQDQRLNLEEYWGHNIARALFHGINDEGYTMNDPTEIVEEDYDDPPLCKEHR